MRQARDGMWYTKEQFVEYYAERGEAMWNEAKPRGAAELASASVAVVLGPCVHLPADDCAHLAEPLPVQAAAVSEATQPAEQHPPSPHTPIDASARAEGSTQHHVNTSTGTEAPFTVRRMDGGILQVDLTGANNVGEAPRKVATATRNDPDRVRLVDGVTVLDDKHAAFSVHLASSDKKHLSMAVRKEMLKRLESVRPAFIAGDINTSECVMRHWMQTTGIPFASGDSASTDAGELGDTADCVADFHLNPDEAVRFKTDGVRAIDQAQQTLLEAEEESVDFGGTSSDEECEPAEGSTQHHLDTSTGIVAPSTVRRMDGSILQVDLTGANNVGEARRRVAAATRNNPDRVRLVDGVTVLDDQHAVASRALSLAILAAPPTVVFASLNIGLQRSQAGGKNAARKFTAIARGVHQAFETTKVDAMGLLEVGDAVEGLPAQQATQLLEIIRAQMPHIQLVVHADATGHPYMLLSKAGSNANLADVRVVEGFVSQTWRKALRATLTLADGDVDLWLAQLSHPAPGRCHRSLTMRVREEMLAHLATGRPTVIAGDINTSEFVMRHWMQSTGIPFAPSMANSGAPHVQHGDHTIAAKVSLWQVDHQVGKSFEDPGMQAIDCVSNAHDMVCIILSSRHNRCC